MYSLLNDFSDADSSSSASTEELSNDIDVIDRNDREDNVNHGGISLQNNQETETLIPNNLPQTSMYFV